MIALNRIQVFLLGCFVIFLFYAVDKIAFIIKGKTAAGTVVDHRRAGRTFYSVVEFEDKEGRTIRFRGGDNLDYDLGEPVTVIYDPSFSTDAYMFTFGGFYMRGLFWMIIPVFLWASFSLSYIDTTERLLLSRKGIKKVAEETL